MRGSEKRIDLPLAPSAAGCSCCSGSSVPQPGATAASGIEFGVEGLTCGHCVQAVEKAVLALEGVDSAFVDLVPGGRSRLVVGGKADAAALRKAVSSAGYTLSSI